MDDMALSHGRDYTAKTAMENVTRTINALLAMDHNRVPPKLAGLLGEARDGLKDQCDHIVRVWD
jgi:hypothetical protein